MAFADDVATMTTDIIGSLGEDVTLYPVRAAAVAAYLSAGDVGTTISAVVERRSVLNDDLSSGAGIENTSVIATVAQDVSDANALNDRRSSILHGGRLYDIVLVVPDDPGAVECTLREYV